VSDDDELVVDFSRVVEGSVIVVKGDCRALSSCVGIEDEDA
jgi:hypothetical protein